MVVYCPHCGSTSVERQPGLAENGWRQKRWALARVSCIKEMIAKRWQEWFQTEYPDEYALAGQRIEEMGLRCHDGR